MPIIQNIFDKPGGNKRDEFVKKYGSLDKIKKTVFQNKIEDITAVS